MLWVDDEKIAEALSDWTRVKILLLLKNEDSLTTLRISEKLGKHRSTISRHLAKLAEAGLIEKIETREGYVYTLTSKGREIAIKIAEGYAMTKISPIKRVNFKILLNVLLGATALGVLFLPIKIHAFTRLLILAVLIFAVLLLNRKIRKSLPK